MIGDFFVRATMPDMATGAAADLPLDTEEAIKQIAGIEQVSGIAMEQARSDDDTVLVLRVIFEARLWDYSKLPGMSVKTLLKV